MSSGEPRFLAARSDPVRRAFRLARDAHDGDERKGDGSPFITHPVRVAELLAGEGFGDEVIAAALLHDVVEKSDRTLGDVADAFGTDVAELVAAMTEDDAIEGYEERKDAHREQVAEAGRGATAIYVADKLANLRDMRRLYSRVGESAADRFTAPTLDARVRAWRRDASMAARIDPGLPLLAQLRGELAALERQRASARERSAS